MGETIRNINWTKYRGILIIGICLGAALLDYLIQPFRGTWIYTWGSIISLPVFYVGVLASFINTIMMIGQYKADLKNNLIWILISAIPFLYIAIMMTIFLISTI